MAPLDDFLREHERLTRRFFLRAGLGGAAATACWPLIGTSDDGPPALQAALEKLESYLTRQDEFRDVSRGKPIPHTLSAEAKQAAGLTRDTWSLDVVSDPDNPADLKSPLSAETGNPFTFSALMELAKKHSVIFAKVMTCNNIGCPLGMGIWEGVPLRELVWLAQPRRNVRRVFFKGFHNDDPKQEFRSSLPIGRVLEDPFDLPPVILCYKLNGEWLSSERGGPVRIVVPECYGFKSVKWLSRLTLTNLWHANDTYANGNNDIDSWLKTFAATLSVPPAPKPGEPIVVTGYAQVGISGLRRVQVWVQPEDAEWPRDDRYFQKAPWQDAEILSPPQVWGGSESGALPGRPIGFNEDGRPERWPLRLAKMHWAAVLPGLAAGEYTFRCRTIDGNGKAQPLPRPFDKSGRNSIEQVSLIVEA